MSEVVKGAIGGAWGLIVGWILPVLIGLVLFAYVVAPSLEGVSAYASVVGSVSVEGALVLVISSIVFGLVLSTLQTPLYRVLEGYVLWPGWLRDQRRDAHRRRRDELRDAASGSGEASLTLDRGLALERYLRYPVNDSQIAPTRLGNNIRRFETYGEDRYHLDTQVLWYALRAAAPESLVKEVDAARSGVDFFVCSCWVTIALGVSALVTLRAPGSDTATLVIVAVAAVAVAVATYVAAVAATDSWASAVRALVDVGRKPLADALGLEMPARLEDERTMWRSVAWLTVYPYDPLTAVSVNRFRARRLGDC